MIKMLKHIAEDYKWYTSKCPSPPPPPPPLKKKRILHETKENSPHAEGRVDQLVSWLVCWLSDTRRVP